MSDALFYLFTSFWLGAVHAATPGHGKTIAAAYIVGVRGRPIDAVILGIFVTLSHISGIVIVGVLASLGLPGLMPQQVEAYLAVATGLLIIVIGLWTLWTQRDLVAQLRAQPTAPASGALRYATVGTPQPMLARAAGHHHHHDHAHDHGDGHHHHHDHDHDHESGGFHSHGWGFKHTHDIGMVTRAGRPSLWMLIGLGVAGGLLPDPAALAILLNALAQGKVMLGLGTVVVFSLGFALTLVGVGVVAAIVGRKVLDWLAGPWAICIQIGTSLLIVLVGVYLTVKAWSAVATFA
jgi:nickel/cobalt exporter